MTDDKIESELPEPAEVRSTEAQEPHDDSSGGISAALIGGILIFAIGAAGVAWLLISTESADTFSYSKEVQEVMADPESMLGRNLTVQGDLLVGSIEFDDDPCEHRFTIQREGHSMDVRFPRCVVPDTFVDRPGVIITVKGQLAADHSFDASQVIPKCPTRYNPDEHALSVQEAG